MSELREAPPVQNCSYNETLWDQSLDTMYTYFYLLLLIPGLLLNTIALWVLCKHIRYAHTHINTHIKNIRYILTNSICMLFDSKKTKAVIFMINLAIADLAHTLSLPLRVFYYFTQTWPFGRGICLVCFYLKYLNMYAAIVFLVSRQFRGETGLEFPDNTQEMEEG